MEDRGEKQYCQICSSTKSVSKNFGIISCIACKSFLVQAIKDKGNLYSCDTGTWDCTIRPNPGKSWLSKSSCAGCRLRIARRLGFDWTFDDIEPTMEQPMAICGPTDAPDELPDEGAPVLQEQTTQDSPAQSNYSLEYSSSPPTSLTPEGLPQTPPPTSPSVSHGNLPRRNTVTGYRKQPKVRPKRRTLSIEPDLPTSRSDYDSCSVCENPNNVRFANQFGIVACTNCICFLQKSMTREPAYKCEKSGNCSLKWQPGRPNAGSKLCGACRWTKAFYIPGFKYRNKEHNSLLAPNKCCVCSKPDHLRALPRSDLKYCSNCQKFIENVQKKNFTFECCHGGNCVIRWAPFVNIHCNACRLQKFIDSVGYDARHKVQQTADGGQLTTDGDLQMTDDDQPMTDDDQQMTDDEQQPNIGSQHLTVKAQQLTDATRQPIDEPTDASADDQSMNEFNSASSVGDSQALVPVIQQQAIVKYEEIQDNCSVCNSSEYVTNKGPFGRKFCFECLLEIKKFIETRTEEHSGKKLEQHKK